MNKKTSIVDSLDKPQVITTPIIVDVPKTLAPIPDAQVIDAKTLTYLIYLLYKTDTFTRYQVKGALEVIKKPAPDDVLKYLMDEIKKI